MKYICIISIYYILIYHTSLISGPLSTVVSWYRRNISCCSWTRDRQWYKFIVVMSSQLLAALTRFCPRSPVILLSMLTLTSPRFSPFVLHAPLILLLLLLLLFPNCRWLPPPVWFAGSRVPNASKVAASLCVLISDYQSAVASQCGSIVDCARSSPVVVVARQSCHLSVCARCTSPCFLMVYV